MTKHHCFKVNLQPEDYRVFLEDGILTRRAEDQVQPIVLGQILEARGFQNEVRRMTLMLTGRSVAQLGTIDAYAEQDFSGC